MTTYCAPCLADLALVREAVTAVHGTASCMAHAVLLTHPHDTPQQRLTRLGELRTVAEGKLATASVEDAPAIELLVQEFALAGAMDMSVPLRELAGDRTPRPPKSRRNRPGRDGERGPRPEGERGPRGDRPERGDRPDRGERGPRPEGARDGHRPDADTLVAAPADPTVVPSGDNGGLVPAEAPAAQGEAAPGSAAPKDSDALVAAPADPTQAAPVTSALEAAPADD